MRAVLLQDYGGPENLYIGEVANPIPDPEEVVIQVYAAGINRTDLSERSGVIKAPGGNNSILGLEVAGVILSVGSKVMSYQPGDRVCALLSGGGYAQCVAVHQATLILLPPNLSFVEGAALPETFLTAYLTLVTLGEIFAGSNVLIHAGASGVGTSAIQLARVLGANALVTAGSEKKIEACKRLGAAAGFNHHEGSFAPFVLAHTKHYGADIILDCVGGSYFLDNISSLAADGKMIIIGTLGGKQVTGLDLSLVMRKRLSIIGSTLRSRSVYQKGQLVKAFMTSCYEYLTTGELSPVIDTVLPWEEISYAHSYMEGNMNVGKIVITIEQP